jgi:hypothetical protein
MMFFILARKLVRQIILEINSLDMQTHRNFLFLVVPLLFIILFFTLTNIFYLALSQSEKPRRTQCTIRSAVNHLQNLFNVKTVS